MSSAATLNPAAAPSVAQPPAAPPSTLLRLARLTPGLATLPVFVLIVYVGASVAAIGNDPAVAALPIVWALFILFEIVREMRTVWGADAAKQTWDLNADGRNALAVVGGGFLTFWINVTLERGPVLASGIVGALAAALIKNQAAAAFCGSFVGMAAGALFDYWLIAVASSITAVLFVLAKHSYNGFGGKLGTMAWSGCVLAVLVFGKDFQTAPVRSWEAGWLLILYSGASAVATFVLSHTFKQGPVMASALVGIAGELVLPKLHPTYGALCSLGVYTASFAGMSGLNRFKDWRPILPAGLICGLVIMYFYPFLQGGGGKLGTTALGAVLGVRGMLDAVEPLLRRAVSEPAKATSESAGKGGELLQIQSQNGTNKV